MDEQFVRPKDEEFKNLLDRFTLVRIVDMNNVDIRRIQFDFDLVFAVVFMNSNEHVYSRYGNRTAWNAESRFSLSGLKYTMRQVLEVHDNGKHLTPKPIEPLFVRDLFSSKRSCVHCHQVWEGLRNKARKEKTFDPESLFVYPPPENIGLELDVDIGNKVLGTKLNSACAKAEIVAGDIIKVIEGHSIFSQADITWALHNGPSTGAVSIEFSRNGKTKRAQVRLKPGWRETKLSWRASMREEDKPRRKKP